MIAGCSQNGKAIEALDLLRKMQTMGLRPDKVTIHLLVTSLWKYRSIDAWKGSPLLFHQNWIVQCPAMFVASASSFSTLF